MGSETVPVYQRILLKLSGEALQGENGQGLSPAKLAKVSEDIAQVAQLGVQVGVVIGGGNLVRGSDFSTTGLDRVTSDQMGMLATMINGLALRDAFSKRRLSVAIYSALPVRGLVDCYDRLKAIDALEQGKVVIFVGGTGNPLVTTDSAAALRGIETRSNVLIKATKVDGVFSSDPIKDPTAERYSQLTYGSVLAKRLGVMDLNSILLCQDHSLPLRIFNMTNEGALLRIVLGENIGTLIQGANDA